MEEFQRVGNWLEHRSHRTEFEVRQQLSIRSMVELSMQQTEDEILRRLHLCPAAKAQVEALLGLPGMGLVFAVALVCELGPMEDYASAQSYAAHAGLNPCRYESGLCKGKSRISKAGNKWVLEAGWMPDRAALANNPPIQVLAKRLEEKGLAPKQIRTAAMRKLVMQAYGVLKALHDGRAPIYPISPKNQEKIEQGKPISKTKFAFRHCPSRTKAKKDTGETPNNKTKHRKIALKPLTN